MILSRAGMAFKTTTRAASPSPSAETSSTSDIRPNIYNIKGKDKAIAQKPWADEPWPLIEPLYRIQRITHPAHHIANELTNTHNAMLRGLNTLYLQAPFIRNPVDITNFLFLTQAWSGWVLDYHELKENSMIPDFEAALGLESKALRGIEGSPSVRGHETDDSDTNSITQGEEGKEDVDSGSASPDLATLLQGVQSYAVETHPQPLSYSPSTLRALLTSLASVLVPHLHNQIGILLQMEAFCPSSPPSNSSHPSLQSIPSFPSLSPSPAPSHPSTTNSISTPPSSTLSALSKSTNTSESATPPAPSRPPPPPPPFSTTPVSSPRTPPPSMAPSARASALTQIHLAAESSFAAAVDRYTVPPMAIRLRDAAHDGAGRLSVPAIHAVADRLSPRHAGAWRFLPCDVWGRRRGLDFLGDGE